MKDRRRELGLTVVELVEKSGVSRSTWRELEAAQRGRLTAPVGVKIDKALGWARGEASAIFNEAPAEMALVGSAVEVVRHPRYTGGGDTARQLAGYRELLETQQSAITARLATLADAPTWIDELLGAWQRLSLEDRATFLRLILLAARAGS